MAAKERHTKQMEKRYTLYLNSFITHHKHESVLHDIHVDSYSDIRNI